MVATVSLRERLREALEPLHCKHHPLIQTWARGELSREAMALWAKEHFHYTKDFYRWYAKMIAACPWPDGRQVYIETIAEEYAPGAEHKGLVLRFAKACGADPEYVARTRPLPSTAALCNWLELLTSRGRFLEMMTGQTIAQESQSVEMYPPILPALRDHYRFREEDIAFFTEHIGADTEHGGRALDVVERYAKPDEYNHLVDMIREGAQQRWFYFDGIYIQGVLGYRLGPAAVV